MHTEVPISRPNASPRGMVIDCSQTSGERFPDLLEWVRACPEKQSLRIILPSVHSQPGRRCLLTSLQILGCRVTARM